RSAKTRHVRSHLVEVSPCGRAILRSLVALWPTTQGRPIATHPAPCPVPDFHHNRLIQKEFSKISSGTPGEWLYYVFSGWPRRLVASLPLNSENPICRPVIVAGRRPFGPTAMTAPNRPDHIRLTSHPDPEAKARFPLHWDAPTARERGPVIGTVSKPGLRNV